MAGLFVQSAAVVGYARVAVERGVDRYPDGLTYAVPADVPELAELGPGDRVAVPLGKSNRVSAGYVIDVKRDAPDGVEPDRIKPIHSRDAAAASLTPQLIALAKWISSYYCAPIGMTLASVLPAAVKRNIGSVTKTMLDLGDPLPLDEKLPPKQRHILEVLASLDPAERPIEMRTLATLAEVKTTGPIRKLLDRGLIEQSKKTTIEAAWIEHARDVFAPEQLTPQQRKIVDEIFPAISGGFSVHLLYGITGSGKTEVYIRLIQQVVAQRKVALLLVPEISLTPQTGGRLIGRFPEHRVAVLHSGLTAAQRHQQWSLVAQDRAAIVIGARSAVFAPIPDDRLGLVIVDEEHDTSYKQDQVPRYHGRDVAIRRAQLARCPVLLGSATPSLESWHNATAARENELPRPRYMLHRLDERIPGAKLPRVQVVDFIEQMRTYKDRRVHLIGPILQGALEKTLRTGGQAIILLNRRGYANYIACPDHYCGWVMQCAECDVAMVYHKAAGSRSTPTTDARPAVPAGYVRCHHCLAEQKLPSTCPECGNRVSTFGLGTQRVEEELSRIFPPLIEGQTMLRVDSDSMHGSRDFHAALARFGNGELKVLLGTQMIAKGLDFPNVKLVGIINADTAINMPDFRAAERTFQLVSQVSGRSGRGVEPGRVVVQSFNPGAPAIRLAAEHRYEDFARLELRHRTHAGLPPVTRLARIVVRDEDHLKCLTRAKQLADGLRSMTPKSIRLRGPVTCPIARIAGKHRQQVEIIAPSARALQELLAKARSAGLIKSGELMAIDVDALALM